MSGSRFWKWMVALLFLVIAPLSEAAPLPMSLSSIQTPAEPAASPAPPPSVPAGKVFQEIGKVGVGFAMAPATLATNLPGTIIPGFLDFRYWAKNRWGVDAGVGMGVSDIAPGPVSTQWATHEEALYRLVEQSDSVFFVDMNIETTLSLQSHSNAGSILVSGGIGFEKAFLPAPYSISLQWNPLSLDSYSLPGKAPIWSYGLLGIPVNFMVGIHYYFR